MDSKKREAFLNVLPDFRQWFYLVREFEEKYDMLIGVYENDWQEWGKSSYKCNFLGLRTIWVCVIISWVRVILQWIYRTINLLLDEVGYYDIEFYDSKRHSQVIVS